MTPELSTLPSYIVSQHGSRPLSLPCQRGRVQMDSSRHFALTSYRKHEALLERCARSALVSFAQDLSPLFDI